MPRHEWTPHRHGWILWRLQQVVFSDWAGTGYRYLKYRNGWVRSFWTRRRAQAEADRLNAQALQRRVT